MPNSFMRGESSMKRNRGFSFFRVRGLKRKPPFYAEPVGDQVLRDGPVKLTGSALEQAYRALLLENQVLQETNQRLHERLASQERGLEDSPAAKELIRSQRNALVEKSHRLRELEYESKQLQREKKKLLTSNHQLSVGLAQKVDELKALVKSQDADGLALAEAKMALRETKNELAKLTDKYYQLEAQLHRESSGSVANGDF